MNELDLSPLTDAALLQLVWYSADGTTGLRAVDALAQRLGIAEFGFAPHIDGIYDIAVGAHHARSGV